ncbi:MAG TPA: KpsF/GutQ family sugar-phosphate isomerase [Sphingomonas sp.]|nr:KpsF/GutQ family sugar-phosphate isomerase [Sphingomonas sp.]
MTPARARAANAVRQPILTHGREAIRGEARALEALADMLDERFADAVLTLATARGRVVVSGLGKSGHVARKIAATLMATGLPSLFVHAGDAAHGDLGALAPGDVVLVLSLSGETRECAAVAAHGRRLGCRVIAVTARADSALAHGADGVMLLPEVAEICPFGASPTTSTTMMLALGDALAVAAMRFRSVSREQLHALHPGGRLGRDLVPVAAFMHRGDALPLVAADTAMSEVLAVISAKGFGIAAVTDADGRLLGVVTDGDIRRAAAVLGTASAGEVMTRDARTVRADAVARDALALMSQCRITALMVVEGGAAARVAGLVHVHDMLALGVS